MIFIFLSLNYKTASSVGSSVERTCAGLPTVVLAPVRAKQRRKNEWVLSANMWQCGPIIFIFLSLTTYMWGSCLFFISPMIGILCGRHVQNS